MPPSEITPTSVVPPPMSTTIEPLASRHRQAGADRGGHGFLDQVDRGGAGASARVLDGAALDLGRAAGHADDDARARREQRARVHHLDELLEHLLGDRRSRRSRRPSSGGSPRCCRAPCRAWPWLRGRRPGSPSCRAGRLRGGWRRPRARPGRCPCCGRRSGCWRCRGRWPGRSRSTDGKLQTLWNPLEHGMRVGRPSPSCWVV